MSKEKLEKMDAIMEATGSHVSAKEYVSETIDNAVEGIFENYKSGRHEWDSETRKEVEERFKEIEEYWEDVRRRK